MSMSRKAAELTSFSYLEKVWQTQDSPGQMRQSTPPARIISKRAKCRKPRRLQSRYR